MAYQTPATSGEKKSLDPSGNLEKGPRIINRQRGEGRPHQGREAVWSQKDSRTQKTQAIIEEAS